MLYCGIKVIATGKFAIRYEFIEIPLFNRNNLRFNGTIAIVKLISNLFLHRFEGIVASSLKGLFSFLKSLMR